ncbi:MAG TPA: histidine--tRNA ligase [Candidatus Nanoarchaeia archaeon]|nr:histidine--tRNA ligase [Candidatus Nanoarchaeia archaeon]
MEIQSAKGTRDYGPQEKIFRDQVCRTLAKVFAQYGFPPFESATLQRYDLLAAKYAGGAEILKETFKLRDQGNRELALRYDLTVPLALFIGQNPMMKMPFKRYEIGKVFRDGPIKAGRVREFWQCDVDIVGSSNILADAELVLLALDAFAALGIRVRIEINSRKILDGFMEVLNIPEAKRFAVITAIDKMKKIPIAEIRKELTEQGISDEQTEELLTSLSGKSNAELLAVAQKKLTTRVGKEGIAEISAILAAVKNVEGKSTVMFNPYLARGLAYYTGPICEAFVADGSFRGAVMGGGRYDRMIADFIGGNRQFPATGISFGLEPILAVLQNQESAGSTAQMYIVPVGDTAAALDIAQQLRAAGLRVDIDLQGRGPSKNLEYVRALGIGYALFVGTEELRTKKYKLRDMTKGKEELLDLKKIIQKFSSR